MSSRPTSGQKLRVAVLCGGRSGEHEVSLRSAEAIIHAIDRSKYDVQRILITKEGRWDPRAIVPEPGANPDIDIVFPIVHGTFGEDGTLQGLLELADLPYVGPGVLASAAAMDKEIQKRLCVERDLPVVDYVVTYRGEWNVESIWQRLPFPLFVKPANLGSSVGISKAKNPDELKSALELAGKFDRKIVVERGVTGREFECAVLGNRGPIAATPCEILPSKDFYDYEDKYVLGKSQAVLPADITPEQTREIQRLAIEAYRAVDCEGLARVDFFLEAATGNFLINEINTLPGFTSVSMFPKMWEASGLAYPQLIDKLIELAMERHRERQATSYTQ